MHKHSASLGSALPDPIKDQDTVSPLPQPRLENKPPPGQTGPRGMQPRQTYSRVNTGAPEISDAGSQLQKGIPPMGLGSLPQKVAADMGTMIAKPTLQDMIKAAMAGTVGKVDITKEAMRQARNQGVDVDEEEKIASAPDHIPTELVTKLAGAIGYIAEQIKQADEASASGVGPGQGPNALEVLEATSSEKNIDAGQLGGASSQNTPPKNPGIQAEEVQSGKANTGLETNDAMSHGEQPTEPISNERTGIGPSTGDGDFKTGSAKLAQETKEAILGSMGSWGGRVGARRAAVSAAKKTPKTGMGPGLMSEVGKMQANKTPGPALAALLKKTGASMEEYELLKAAMEKAAVSLGSFGRVGGRVGGGRAAVSGARTGSAHVGPQLGQEIQKMNKKPGAWLQQAQASAARGPVKAAGAPYGYIRGIFNSYLEKAAEDAINPAQISGGASTPPESSASEEHVPSQPSDVSSQTSMISSNEAAINYTKGQAKKDPVKDVGQLLNETPMNDPVLGRVLDNAGKAGIKTSSAMVEDTMKVAAARTYLAKLASQIEDKKKKEKSSQMGGMATPQSASGFNAGSMM